MYPSFNLTQELIENADIYDSKKHAYIHNYLKDYFREKLPLLSLPEQAVKCPTHDMERYTVEDEYIAAIQSSCVF